MSKSTKVNYLSGVRPGRGILLIMLLTAFISASTFPIRGFRHVADPIAHQAPNNSEQLDPWTDPIGNDDPLDPWTDPIGGDIPIT